MIDLRYKKLWFPFNRFEVRLNGNDTSCILKDNLLLISNLGWDSVRLKNSLHSNKFES